MSKRTNEQWLADLAAGGSTRESALADLRAVILFGLSFALVEWMPSTDPRFAAVADEAAQETLVRVLARLDSFEGRSQFTTWVHKIAVRVALTELRRRHWKDVSLESLLENDGGDVTPQLAADPAPGPEAAAELADLIAQLDRIMNEELTPKQLRAMTIVGVKGIPLEEAARRLGTERNALYKLLHDARLRLKRRLARDGLSPADLLPVFERR